MFISFCSIYIELCILRGVMNIVFFALLNYQEKATGRMPSEQEERYAFKHGIWPVLEELEAKGELINWAI